METSESEIVALPGGAAQVAWRRNARARRVSLRIDARTGTVVVTLPARTGRRAGLALLTEHAGWVAERLEALPCAVPFAPGARVPIDGVEYPACHVPEGRGGAWIEDGEIVVSGGAAFFARRLRDFLRAEARVRLGRRIAAMAARAGVRPSRLLVKDTLSRWGSCAADRTIALSWRLVMAPPFVQDYVAAHEVAHLRHMNHGPAFWALVARLTPHRAAAQAWLGAQGTRLQRIGEEDGAAS